ncbi:hypothetical protein DAEQUDRAFT_187764 [Daedalea quercina L-15889]|uniref:Uncharacterized protein n=1 Tax=Daedalea quercina L-15889 TaxID=1314783 RepID=A0A165U2N3_9APHY|nr:hypothetical protein DAEQUDRAFT_187764 [Daedalea quercina L-15889]
MDRFCAPPGSRPVGRQSTTTSFGLHPHQTRRNQTCPHNTIMVEHATCVYASRRVPGDAQSLFSSALSSPCPSSLYLRVGYVLDVYKSNEVADKVRSRLKTSRAWRRGDVVLFSVQPKPSSLWVHGCYHHPARQMPCSRACTCSIKDVEGETRTPAPT